MLCSFDYIVTSKHVSRGWWDDVRAAFLDDYGGSAGILMDVLLAYEADKAIYRVIYETRNRPIHLHIPVDYLTGIES